MLGVGESIKSPSLVTGGRLGERQNVLSITIRRQNNRIFVYKDTEIVGTFELSTEMQKVELVTTILRLLDRVIK